MMSKYIMEKWKRKKSRVIHKLWGEGDTEELRARRNRLICVTCFPPWAKVMSRIRPWSMLLLKIGSLLTSMTHAAIKSHTDACCLLSKGCAVS